MKLKWTNKINDGLLLLLTVFVLSSCESKNNSSQWNEAKIDSDIKNEPIYYQLDKQNEIFSMFEKQDSTVKRTSGVSYFRAQKINLKDTAYTTFNNCRAYFYNSDTLSIKIGFGGFFGGSGFIIEYKNRKFHTEAYLFSDGNIGEKIKPKHKLVYQKLILDKVNYNIGDSLYGKIDFKSIETDKYGDTTEHFGKGYFRTKIMEAK